MKDFCHKQSVFLVWKIASTEPNRHEKQIIISRIEYIFLLSFSSTATFKISRRKTNKQLSIRKAVCFFFPPTESARKNIKRKMSTNLPSDKRRKANRNNFMFMLLIFLRAENVFLRRAFLQWHVQFRKVFGEPVADILTNFHVPEAFCKLFIVKSSWACSFIALLTIAHWVSLSCLGAFRNGVTWPTLMDLLFNLLLWDKDRSEFTWLRKLNVLELL